MSAGRFQVGILPSNKNFFLPFLWQVGEFSLVCEGGEGRSAPHMSLFHNLFISYSNREKRDLKEEEEKTENLQNVSVRKTTGGDEALAPLPARRDAP